MAGPAPMPPEAARSQGEAPMAPEGGEGGGGQLSDLLQNLAQGMSILDDTLTSAGVAPDLAQKVSAIRKEFMGVLEQIAGGGGGAPQQGQPAPAAMEQGQGGVPMSPASR